MSEKMKNIWEYLKKHKWVASTIVVSVALFTLLAVGTSALTRKNSAQAENELLDKARLVLLFHEESKGKEYDELKTLYGKEGKELLEKYRGEEREKIEKLVEKAQEEANKSRRTYVLDLLEKNKSTISTAQSLMKNEYLTSNDTQEMNYFLKMLTSSAQNGEVEQANVSSTLLVNLVKENKAKAEKNKQATEEAKKEKEAKKAEKTAEKKAQKEQGNEASQATTESTTTTTNSTRADKVAALQSDPDSRAWLGTVTQELPNDNGLMFWLVFPDCAAYQAGLREDDVMLAIDGATTSTQAQYEAIMMNHVTGDTITLTLRNGQSTRQLAITLQQTMHDATNYPESSWPLDETSVTQGGNSTWDMGISGCNVGKAHSDKEIGMGVTTLNNNCPISAITTNDFVIKVDKYWLTDQTSLLNAWSNFPSGSTVEVVWMQANGMVYTDNVTKK